MLLTITPRANKQLKKFEQKLRHKLQISIESLIDNPFPNQAKKLSNQQGFWRIRISDYRIIYKVDIKAKIIIVTAIAHRREIYKM